MMKFAEILPFADALWYDKEKEDAYERNILDLSICDDDFALFLGSDEDQAGGGKESALHDGLEGAAVSVSGNHDGGSGAVVFFYS